MSLKVKILKTVTTPTVTGFEIVFLFFLINWQSWIRGEIS